MTLQIGYKYQIYKYLRFVKILFAVHGFIREKISFVSKADSQAGCALAELRKQLRVNALRIVYVMSENPT